MSFKRKKEIWLINHYASCPDYPNEHRHHDLAKELVRRGYEVSIIAASTMHNMNVNLIDDKSDCLSIERNYDGVTYIFIKTQSYSGNGLARILNMRDYIKRLPLVTKKMKQPDVIYVSSPHLFSLKTGLDIASSLKVPCITEVRDLWPESLVAYGYLNGKDLISRYLYKLEREAYERSDALVFTMEGGADYIQDKGWDFAHGGKVNLSKVYHVNNGIDLEAFDRNAATVKCDVECLNSRQSKKVVYAGSIRKVNDIGFLVDVAKEMQGESVDFVILGDGDERNSLLAEVSRQGLDNIFFPGAVDKKAVPACLGKASLLLQWSAPQPGLSKYGTSLNKLFDYLAAGKPILANLPSKYSIVNSRNCGIEREFSSVSQYADQIRRMLADENAIEVWSVNARKTAEEYSFVRLADGIVRIIEKITGEEEK